MASVGRPTKCNQDMIDMAIDYLTNYKDHDHIIPSIAGMSVVLKVNRSTLYEWAKNTDKVFSNILEECMTNQEIKLFNGGLSGDFNAAIAKLALGKHGYSDRVETESNVNLSLSDLSEDQLNAKLKALNAITES